jgi:4-hydroxybenzoate polyprenyltransferase
MTPSPARRWTVFVRERYEPLTHGLMASAFAIGNAGVAASAVTPRAATDPGRTALSIALVVLFFFRLRIFDEIKDFETDLVAHPHRPLARGLLSLREASRAALIVSVFEAGVAALLGWGTVLTWAAALVYSLAMFKEFGVGSWLRPRMELYAVSHTLVASLLGLTVACAVTDLMPWMLPPAVWLFAPANWALFNVFEFSRKTFAPTEESEEASSYSSRWGPDGAAAITLSWSMVALAMAAGRVPRLVVGADTALGALAFGVAALLIATPYLMSRRASAARLFRVAMSVWATSLYLATGLKGLGGIS